MKNIRIGLLCLSAGLLWNCNSEKTGYSKDSNYKETAFDMELSMVYVEGGTFTMGALPENVDADDDLDQNKKTLKALQKAFGVESEEDTSSKEHKITLFSYHIGRYEITQAQYRAVMGKNPSYFEGDSLPVERITWDKAMAFCDSLSKKTGKKYTLPTEAQWEFAARGGNKSKGYKYSGGNEPDEVAWYWNNNDEEMQRIGTKKPNELGIYDMSGNAMEWCADWYAPYSEADATNPTGPASGEYRVMRGTAVYSRSFSAPEPCKNLDALMRFAMQGRCGSNLGFRVVCLSE